MDGSHIQVAVRIRPLSGNEGSDCTCITAIAEPQDAIKLTAESQDTIKLSSTASTEDSITSNSTSVSISEYKTVQVGDRKSNRFTFDHVFPPSTTHEELYSTCVSPLIHSCLKGYNATVLAYGQAGSGKSHTIVGDLKRVGKQEHKTGILPRALHDIFLGLERIELECEKSNEDYHDSREGNQQPSLSSSLSKPTFEYQVKVQFLELNGSHIQDLIGKHNNTSRKHRGPIAAMAMNTNKTVQQDHERRLITGLSIRDDKAGIGTVVIGAHCPKVQSSKEALQYFMRGNKLRKTNRHTKNGVSSSHAVFTLFIQQKRTIVPDVNMTCINGDRPQRDYIEVVKSKIHFVDLGGSLRMKNNNPNCALIHERIHINKDLLALANSMTALSNIRRKKVLQHVPYRDSKLTRMLKGSLGGNHKTLMIACVSPSNSNIDESKYILRNANNAKNIINKAKPNLFSRVQKKALTHNSNIENDGTKSANSKGRLRGVLNERRKNSPTPAYFRRQLHSPLSLAKNHKKKHKSCALCKRITNDKPQNIETDLDLTKVINVFSRYLHALPTKKKDEKDFNKSVTSFEQDRIPIYSSTQCQDIYRTLKERQIQLKSKITAYTRQKESVDSAISLLKDGSCSRKIPKSIAMNQKVSILSHKKLDNKLQLSEGKLREFLMELESEQLRPAHKKNQSIDLNMKRKHSCTSINDMDVGSMSTDVNHDKKDTACLKNSIHSTVNGSVSEIATTNKPGMQTEPLIKTGDDECILDEDKLVSTGDSDLTNEVMVSPKAIDTIDLAIDIVEDNTVLENEQLKPVHKEPQPIDSSMKKDHSETTYDDIIVGSMSTDVNHDKKDTACLNNSIHSTINDSVSGIATTNTPGMQTEPLIKTGDDECILDEDNLVATDSDLTNEVMVQTKAIDTVDLSETPCLEDCVNTDLINDFQRDIMSGIKVFENIESETRSDIGVGDVKHDMQETQELSQVNMTSSSGSKHKWFRSMGTIMSKARAVDRKRTTERKLAFEATMARKAEAVGKELTNGNLPHVSPKRTPKRTKSTSNFLRVSPKRTPKNTKPHVSFPIPSPKKTRKIFPLISPKRTHTQTEPVVNISHASPVTKNANL